MIDKKINSLVISVDGVTYTFECHSYDKAIEILASNYNLWNIERQEFPTVDWFELV